MVVNKLPASSRSLTSTNTGITGRVRILAIEIHEEYIKDDVVLKILENEGFVMSRHGELYIGYNLNLF